MRFWKILADNSWYFRCTCTEFCDILGSTKSRSKILLTSLQQLTSKRRHIDIMRADPISAHDVNMMFCSLFTAAHWHFSPRIRSRVFDSPEPDMDNPAYISVLILVFNYAGNAATMPQLFPDSWFIQVNLANFLPCFLSAASGIADIEVQISVRTSIRPFPHFDHFPEVRSRRNRSRICIFEKLISGHRFRCPPKSGSTGAGDKLVIFGHFFALLRTPPTVLIGEC